MNSIVKIVLPLALIFGSLYWLSSSDSATPRVNEKADSRDSDPVASAPLQLNGYPCTEDCSGHEAGYRWAEEHSVTDEDSCGGNSESFIEGCKAYAQEQSDYHGNLNQPAEDNDSDNE